MYLKNLDGCEARGRWCMDEKWVHPCAEQVIDVKDLVMSGN
jgi:hypothetical protein